MGKDLKGKEIGTGIVQQPNGTYFARFVDKFGRRRTKRSKKLQEVKQWLAEATYIDQHSDLDQAADMLVDAWFDYWISIKKQTVLGKVQKVQSLISKSLPVTKMRVFFGNPVVLMSFRQSAS